jgi:hypothetical protein
MGWIGCVSGENTAAGYRRVGGTRMWGPYGNAGGVVQGWINNQSSHWQRFDQQVQMYGPPRAVWIQICVFSPGATIDEVRRVVENTRSRAPDAYLYISGLPLYSAGHMCSLWGPDGPELTDALALQMAMEDPDVHYTGRLGPLGPEDLADECHPNPAGEEELGWQVRLIWGQP